MTGKATVIGKVAIKVTPDTSDFRGDAQRAMNRIEKQLDSIKVKVELATPSVQRVKADLNVLARRREATIAPKIDKRALATTASTLAALSGGRSIQNIGDDIADWAGNLDKQVPKIATMALAVSNLGSVALNSTANLLSLGGSLASIVPAALALPGIFGGLAIGLGASVAVLKDFNQRLPEVTDKVHALQNRMSDKFWKVAEEPIRNLVNSVLPDFSRGLEGTSTALGGFFAKLSRSATGVFDGELNGMFRDLQRSIEVASRFTDNFVGILGKLGSVGAGNLPRLARWVGDIARGFDGWLGAKGTARLQTYIDDGVAALADLGGTLAATGSLFAGLSRAAEASGASTLATLRRTMEGAAEIVNRPTFQNALRNAFAGAREGLDQLTSRSGERFEGFMLRLSDVLAKTLPKAGKTAGDALGAIFDALDQPAVEKSILGFFDDIQVVVDDLAPSLPAVARGLAAVVDVVGSIAKNVSSGLAPLLESIGTALPGLASDFDPLISALGDLVTNAAELASGVLPKLATGLGGVAGGITAILAPVNAFIDLLQKAPEPVKAVTSSLAAIGLLVAGTAWLGVAVRAKILLFGNAMLTAGIKTGVAEGAFLRAGVMAENVGTKMQGARLGLLAVGVAALSMRDDAAKASAVLGRVTSVAGAAAIGFAVGGPIGSAAGALGGVFLTLKDHIDEVNQSLADVDTSIATGSLTAMEDQLRSLNDQIAEMEHSNDGLVQSTWNLINPAAGAKAAYDQLFGTDKLKNGADRLSEAIAHNDDLANLLGATVGRTAAQLRDGASAADEMSDSLGRLNGWFDKRSALRAYKDSIAEVAKGLRDGFTRADAENIDNLGRSITQVADAIKNPAKQQTFLDKARAQLADVAKNSAPKAKAALQDLIHQFDSKGLTSPKPIKLSVDDGRVTQGIKTVRNDLDIMGRSIVEPTISANDNPFKAIFGSVKKAMLEANNLRANPKVAVDPGNSFNLIQSIQTALNNLHDKKITVNVVTKNTHGGSTSSSGGQTSTPADEAQRGSHNAIAYSEAYAKVLEKSLNKISDLYAKALDKAGKHAKALKAQFSESLKSFRDLAREHAKLERQLDNAQAKLLDYQSQLASYAETVKQTVLGSADITQLGAKTYDGIIRALTRAKEKAVAFFQVIKDLIASGLNKTTLQQILAAGPEAGLAVAQAILAGGVGQINDIQSQIEAAAAGVGDAAGQHFFGDLVASAQSDVDKLIKQLGPLQQRLKKFAHDLIESLSEALKKEWKDQMGDGSDANGNGGGGKGNGPKTPTKPHKVAGGAVVQQKVINYYAAAGSSISSEDDLYKALDGARGGWF